MSGTLVSLLESVQARTTCPACDRGTREGQGGPSSWFQDRAVFSCGAVFGVRNNAIVAAQPCGDRSALAAELWTIQARGDVGAVEATKSEVPADKTDRLIAELALALATVAVKGGFDPLTICEIIRDEMVTIASVKVTP